MTRIVIENIFFFLLPTLVYIMWIAFKEDEWAGLSAIVSRAPLLRLFVAGAALMLGTLIAFSSRSHNSPRDVYVPLRSKVASWNPAIASMFPNRQSSRMAKP